jgi:FdhD protein
VSETRRVRIVRWQNGAEPVEVSDELAVEEPLQICIAGEPVSVTMRTPGHDAELVAGFLLSEGLLPPSSVPLIQHSGTNSVNVALTGLRENALPSIRRNTLTAASCGLCGKGSIEAVHQQFPPVEGVLPLSRSLVSAMWKDLERSQLAFRRTGGLHAAAVFNREGTLLSVHEDVGRHNAVDKVIGNAVLRRLLPLDNHILLVSSRASFEIMQKALGARIPMVAVVSAPSSLAVDFAASSGQTLIGFMREGRCNVYTHPERLVL